MHTMTPAMMAASVAQRGISAIWPLRTQRRMCSTLADLQSLLRTLRMAKGLEGGTLRLSISEDLRVFVEHQANPDSVASAVASWQGAAACTVRDAVGHLHSSQEAYTPSTAAAPSTSTAPCQRTLLDGTRAHAKDVQQAMHRLAQSYPQLRLKVQHTSGVDLLGARLHTISVRLVPRGLGVAVASLPAEQQRLVETFDGDSVGDKYSSCLRRALKEACAAAGLSYDTLSSNTAAGLSVLSLYAQLWSRDGFELRLEPLDAVGGTTAAAAVSCALQHKSTRRTLASTCVGLTAEGLRGLLDFCDTTAAEHYRDGHAALHARMRAAPLHLVLPRTRLDVKGLLAKLLGFYYGVDEADLRVQVEVTRFQMYNVEVHVFVSAAQTTSQSDGCAVPPFVLGRAQGSSKGAAAEAAMVQAMRLLFPDVYARELAFHPDIKAIDESGRASATGADPQPLADRGLVAQLVWALKREHATYALESKLLRQHTAFPDIGFATSRASVWQTNLFLVPSGAPDGASAQRELLCSVFDDRKSRCEQKAIAAVLAKRFRHLCGPSIEMAKSRNLLDTNGAPTPCSGLQPLNDNALNVYTSALKTDSFMAALDLQQSRAAQPLPATQTDNSVLEKFWAATQRQDSLLGSVYVTREGLHSLYTARCTRTSTTAAGSQERVVASATAASEISALLALLQHAQSVPEMVAANECEAHAANDVAGFAAAAAPKLPVNTPLQTCAVTVAQLYGLTSSVVVRHKDDGWEADLFGVVPAGSALATPHPRLAQSPFVAGRMFFLGRGRGDSAAVAVLRSAEQTYEYHIRVHQRVFSGETVMSAEMRLTPEPRSRLARLCDGVVTEIKAVSKRDVKDRALVLRWAQSEECRMHFSVAADSKTVVLEDAHGADFLACARALCKHIAAETNDAFIPLASLAEMKSNTVDLLLGKLCQLAYGFTLQTEVTARVDAWDCRLSLQLTAEMRYCIAETRAARKRDAVEAACAAALRTHFAEELPHLGTVFASNAEELTTLKVDSDTYMFRVDKATPPG